jgi:hypothetical protein
MLKSFLNRNPGHWCKKKSATQGRYKKSSKRNQLKMRTNYLQGPIASGPPKTGPAAATIAPFAPRLLTG